MLVVNTVACCNLRLSLLPGFVGFLDAKICRDKTIQFLTQQYMFANVLVSLEGLRSAPMQCQKRFVVLRAQFFGCGICTAPQPLVHDDAYHMAVPYHMAVRWSTMSPTWKTNQFQENGQRYAKSSRCGTAPSFSQKLPGYWAATDGPCFAGSSTICF